MSIKNIEEQNPDKKCINSFDDTGCPKKTLHDFKSIFWRNVIEILQNFERVLWNHILVNISNFKSIDEKLKKLC